MAALLESFRECFQTEPVFERLWTYALELLTDLKRKSIEPITLAVGDGGNWIDPLIGCERLYNRRIIDYYHMVEHLYEAACAARGKDSP